MRYLMILVGALAVFVFSFSQTSKAEEFMKETDECISISAVGWKFLKGWAWIASNRCPYTVYVTEITSPREGRCNIFYGVASNGFFSVTRELNFIWDIKSRPWGLDKEVLWIYCEDKSPEKKSVHTTNFYPVISWLSAQ